ncbi:lkhA [Symbiodinium sp. CCMP2592]|nr:lkhA [Symbiodinium sp. CCMP2592]
MFDCTETWPNCFTRNNVKPDGAPFIEAFPLGIVLNYCLGLVCSRATRLWPTLTKLLAKFIQQEQPDFRYTTMQLNKNYATKMHVDANNHGPSFIIGLGDYTGGEVWIYDENGTVEMELPCALRGWSHLRPGQKVPGRLEDCRNKWLKFDGNTPHMTMPYTGSRISIVYFTRKGWLTMLPETKDTLETSGFMLPGEDYQSLCTTKEDPQAQAKKVAKAPRRIASAQDQIAIDSDDEVDEDEQVDEVLRAEQDSAAWPSGEWARALRRFLYDSSSKLVDDAHELNVTICGSATCAGIALQEFLSEVAPFTISSAHVSGGSGPLRLLKRTCKPQHVFCDLNAALAGSGHCEVQHKACESTRTENQDFLFASFPCEPFLNLDPSKPSCFDDPKSATFLSVRSHLGLRRPRGCLLHCEGWHLLPEASRPSVYSFLMEGEDPRRSEDRQVDWGLSRLQNYGVAFVELPLMKFGVPLAGPDAFVILIRADCGGREAADAAAKLMQAIGELKLPGERKLLPSCTVGALMLPEEDPRVVNGVKEAKQLEKAERAAGGRRKAPKSNTRQLTVEARELGLQPGDARYTELLRGSKPPRDKWLKQAAPDKVVVLNLIYERCRQSGQDISNLCADLSQGFQPIGRRDDGLLPRPSHVSKATSDRPDYYAFSHHRALVGQEILLCHGYPIWRIDFRGLSEAEVLQLAAGSPAVPAVGAGVAAIFAVLDLGPGRNLKLPKSRIHELVKDFAQPAVQASLTAPSTESAEVPNAVDHCDSVSFGLHGGSFGREAPGDSEDRRKETSFTAGLELHLKVDFQRQLFSGECKLVVDKLKPGVCDVVLDVLDLAIHSITDEDDEPVGWRVDTPDGSKAKFGKALFVTLPPGKRSKICVRYETTEKSTAIQWLTREQTTGKKHPLCFTQSQAICGRSLLPCQDTPSVKATFSISVTVPTPLMAVASGEPVGEPIEADGLRTFTYAQKVPVMSYLIAVIVAEFESRVIGKRSRCYAEPAIMEAARQEFSEIVDEFLETAQQVIGGAEYEWGSYNMAVLPSSFAYGGMENPNCTFLSASLIPGDRSLTTTLAHEIVHSWIGNLVTNAYWKDFWLNEGFTRYIERRILGNIHGAAFRGLLLLVGYNDLVKTVDMLNKQGSSGLTRLEPDIDDIDPDDAFSRVPYEKGSLFLFYLEQLVGGEEPMTKYLQSYIQKFRGRSIQTSDMKAHFIEFFKGVAEVKQVDWELWLHGEGIPDFDLTAHVDKTLLEESRQAADRWLLETPQDLQIMSLKAQQVMLILDHLINALADGQSLSHEKLAAMDGQYNLSGTKNVEIGFRCKSSRTLWQVVPARMSLQMGENNIVQKGNSEIKLLDHISLAGDLNQLNLVSHGAFGEAEKAESNDKKAKPGEAAQKIISVLSVVAQPDDGDQEEGRGIKRKQEETAVAESPAVVFEEPLDWQVRLRKLNFGVDPISLDMIIKWVTEAAEDSQAQFSAEIIKSGIAEFLRRVSKEAIPEVLVRERQAFTNKLKEAGFADMAKALDLAIRSMQFSERLQKGSSQTCLDMQTKQSMPAYMNMVVRGCDRQGWPMRRVFLGHLSRVASKSAEGEADGSAPSEGLIEFGKAGGWKYVMSWLDEEPQPTTWPPYHVLDELGSNIPSVGAPLKLFALLHRALTHPGFASSMPAPCLSRLERQLTRAAAPALDLNLDEPRDEKLQRKLHDIASLGGQVGNLFEFLEKLLAFASKVRHPKLDSTPGTTAWLDLQSESRDLVCAYKGLADTPGFGWTSVLKLVAGLTQDLDEIIRENIKAAQQREANVKEEERARLLEEAKARVEASTGTVLSLLANGKLRERSSSGLQDCLGKMKRLGDSMQHLEQLDKSEKSSQSVDAWEAGRAAVKGFCQLKVRCSKALHWLQKRQLGHCAKLLDSAGLLETLDLVRDAQKLKTLGLPFRCQELLVSCVENDGLSPSHLEPKLEEVPDVWEQRTSRNLNLQYFQKVGSSAMSWEWPLPAGLVPWRTDGSAVELLQQQEEDKLLASARRISGAPRPGDPAFVDEGSCLLCQQDATDSHWASPEHRKHAAYWKQLADRLAMICVDLQRLPEEAKSFLKFLPYQGTCGSGFGPVYMPVRRHAYICIYIYTYI